MLTSELGPGDAGVGLQRPTAAGDFHGPGKLERAGSSTVEQKHPKFDTAPFYLTETPERGPPATASSLLSKLDVRHHRLTPERCAQFARLVESLGLVPSSSLRGFAKSGAKLEIGLGEARAVFEENLIGDAEESAQALDFLNFVVQLNARQFVDGARLHGGKILIYADHDIDLPGHRSGGTNLHFDSPNGIDQMRWVLTLGPGTKHFVLCRPATGAWEAVSLRSGDALTMPASTAGRSQDPDCGQLLHAAFVARGGGTVASVVIDRVAATDGVTLGLDHMWTRIACESPPASPPPPGPDSGSPGPVLAVPGWYHVMPGTPKRRAGDGLDPGGRMLAAIRAAVGRGVMGGRAT